jgi:lipopolysaccharide export LptBFGC system permease protein LptF
MSSPSSDSVETTRRFASRLHRRYALFTLCVVLFIVALALL